MKLEKATMAPRIAGNKPKCHENEEIVPGTRSRERHEGAHGNGQSILSVREPIEDDEERVAMRFSTGNLIARYSVICYAQEETSRERTSLEDRRLQHERRRADRKKEEQRAQKGRSIPKWAANRFHDLRALSGHRHTSRSQI